MIRSANIFCGEPHFRRIASWRLTGGSCGSMVVAWRILKMWRKGSNSLKSLQDVDQVLTRRKHEAFSDVRVHSTAICEIHFSVSGTQSACLHIAAVTIYRNGH